MKKTLLKRVVFTTGSLTNLRLTLTLVLHAFPRLYENKQQPRLIIYPPVGNGVLSFKLTLLKCNTEMAPTPALASIVREVLRENPPKTQGQEALSLLISPKAPDALAIRNAQAFVRRKFKKQLAGVKNPFEELPAVTRKQYEDDIAQEQLASQMLSNGEISLQTYLGILLPQINGQKTVIITASAGNTRYVASYLSAHDLPADVINFGESLESRKVKVAAFRKGYLNVLVFTKPTAPKTFTDTDDTSDDDGDLPLEMCLDGAPPQDEVIDIADREHEETPIEWRNLENPKKILEHFPKSPTADDILDLYAKNTMLKSNLLALKLKQVAA